MITCVKDEARAAVPPRMTPGQAKRLKRLSEETCQGGEYVASLSFEEAERRITALEAEIALADSF